MRTAVFEYKPEWFEAGSASRAAQARFPAATPIFKTVHCQNLIS